MEFDLGKFLSTKRQEIAKVLDHLSPICKYTGISQSGTKAAIRLGQNEALKSRSCFLLGDFDSLAIGPTASAILWSLLEWQGAASHPAYQKPPTKEAIDLFFRGRINQRLADWQLTIDDTTAAILISCLDEIAQALFDGWTEINYHTNRPYVHRGIVTPSRPMIIDWTMTQVDQKVQEFQDLESRWLVPTKYV